MSEEKIDISEAYSGIRKDSLLRIIYNEAKKIYSEYSNPCENYKILTVYTRKYKDYIDSKYTSVKDPKNYSVPYVYENVIYQEFQSAFSRISGKYVGNNGPFFFVVDKPKYGMIWGSCGSFSYSVSCP